jgi:hypothetical protein
MTNKQKAIAEIDALRIYPEFKVVQIDDNLWRVNDAFDLYPSTRRIFPVADSRRFMGWKQGTLIEKMREAVKKGITQKLYDVAYYVNNKKHQTIKSGLPYGVALTEKQKAEKTGQYKIGVLRVVICE